MKNLQLLLLILLFVFYPFTASFADTQNATLEKSFPVQIALFDRTALPADLDAVNGIRFNVIYGQLKKMYGLDFGVAQLVMERCVGIQLGIFGNDATNIDGVQLAYAGNFARGTSSFLVQCAPIANSAEDINNGAQLSWGLSLAKNIGGPQIGLVMCSSESSLVGQFSFIKSTTNKLIGIQTGFLGCSADQLMGLQVFALKCEAGKMTGMQYGFFCSCSQEGRGLQVGLLSSGCYGSFCGVQLGTIMTGADNFTGFQMSLFNADKILNGLQIGVLNGCNHSNGCQIGIMNYSKNRIMPLFNWPD